MLPEVYLNFWLLLIASAAYAQPVIDFTAKPCPGDPAKPKLAALLPATVSGSGAAVLVPVCLSLGAGLKINMDAAGGPAIEAEQATQRMVMEKIPAPTFGEQTTVAIPLSNTPAPGTLVLAYYRGGGWWSNQFDAIAPTAGKTVGIVLPGGRLMQPGEYVMLVYWTTEPAK